MELQKASGWKRMAAWILDMMLLCVLAVGAATGLSVVLGYDDYDQKLQASYEHYQTKYDMTFDISQADYEKLSPEDEARYKAAYDALIADEDAMHAYNMMVNLSMLIVSLAVLTAMLVLEFVIPLILKNGQTAGKKCFSLGVVRIDGVKMNHLQLFTRTLLGKFTLETMLPVYIVLMLFWDSVGSMGTLILFALMAAQVISLLIGDTRSAIHDRLAGTVVVDISSQKIFESTEDLIAYTKQIHAERAERQEY